MPVIYDAAVKTARMNAVRTSVADGALELLSNANQVLASFGFAGDAGAVAGSTWTLAFDANTVNGTVAAGTGTNATKARIKDSGGNVRISGLTVGAAGSGTNIEMINTSISSGQPVTINSAAIQHAADPA
jgi:hypothetical protein